MVDIPDREALDRLLGFLDQDPLNPSLLRDAAQAALAAHEPGLTVDLLSRLDEQADALAAADRNLLAIALMQGGDPAQAAHILEQLLTAAPQDAGLRFNLAWARALTADHAGAAGLLDEETTRALPQAAMLEMQLLHEAGAFDEALVWARQHLAIHADYPPLLAAISVLAVDMEDEELARQCAEGADGHPDSLAVLGTLALAEQAHEAARPLFERALAANAGSPRAWIGLGLSDLASGDHHAAGAAIDKGAELFGDHLGSWIAAGWAYLLGGNREKARQRFEHALGLDPNFAESHGSLAVLNVLEGQRASAERGLEVAFGLDRQCFSAAFAKLLIAAGDGDQQTAQRIMDMALGQVLDEKGRTIGEALRRLAR